jgi:spore coat protein U-like protein
MKRQLGLIMIIGMLLCRGEAPAFQCNITTTPVNFGVYDVFAGNAVDSTGSISVSCNDPEKKAMPITVSISSGTAGTFNPRKMRDPLSGQTLNYYLFTTQSGATIWGDGTNGSATVTSIISKAATFNSTVYARIPAGQNVGVGTYSDILTATVDW